MKRILTAMTFLAGTMAVYSQGDVIMNDYNGGHTGFEIQVFPPQSLANSPVQVTVNGYTGYEEMGQPNNSYLPLPGSTVYATGQSTIGPGYDVGLLALDGGGATNYSQLSLVANSVITTWENNAASTNNPSVNNNYGIWNSGLLTAAVPGNATNASVAIAVWKNNGTVGAATTLAQAQANGYEWGVSSIATATLATGIQFPGYLPTSITSFSLVQTVPTPPNGALWVMGFDQYGQLGDGNSSGFSTNRPEVVIPGNVTAIAAGNAHSFYITSDSNLWAMGDDTEGDLGNNKTTQTNRPQLITSNVTAVAAGLSHSLFIKSDGSLWGMGDDTDGQLGDGTNNLSGVLVPELITNGVIAVAAGNYHSLFVMTNGSLWAMGHNLNGQLGDGGTVDTNRPVLIKPGGVKAVACGASHSIFLMTNGSLWAMGDNILGQLGDGGNDNGANQTNSPEMIVPTNVAAISAGQDHTLFIKADGSLWGMGNNGDGELGLGTNVKFLAPTNIVGSNVVAVAGGYNHTLFIENDGSLWGMGDDTVYGDLGDGGSAQVNFPEKIVPNGVMAVAAGKYHSLFIGAPPSAQIAVFNGATPITNDQAGAVPFGSVVQNQAGPILTFTVDDTGGQTLNLTNIAMPAGFTLVTNAPATIAAGGNGSFSVQMDTTAGGTIVGNITITNNDPNNNPFVFPVSGFVSAKTISLSGNLAFGVVTVDSSSNSTLTISNIGNTNLSVTNISFPTGFSGVWSNVVIAPSNSQAVTVTFSPTVVSNYSGTIAVASDATGGTGTIAVSGFGGNTNVLLLTVITNGLGTVEPILTVKPLILGHKYTLTATAKPGNVFSNWTGTFVTNKDPLTFTMEPGTVIEANFIPNPFLPIKGVYNGLFSATNGQITEATAGMLKSLTVGTRGTYSGTLLVNGVGHGLSGTFSLGGLATNKITRPATQGGNLTVVLNLATASNATPGVTGTITATNWVSTNLVADLASNVPFSFEYTMIIPPDTNNPLSNSIPQGDGYAVITNHVGAIKITGALADGTAFNESVPASQAGEVPVYASLYGNKGLLIGWINLSPTNAGALSWVHPSERTGLFESNFVSTNSIVLSGWTNLHGPGVLPTNMVVLTYTNGIVTQSNALVFTVSNNFKVGEVSGTLPLSGSLNPKTGQLTLTLGSDGGKHAGSAVILPEGTNGGGFFVTKTNSGAIKILP